MARTRGRLARTPASCPIRPRRILARSPPVAARGTLPQRHAPAHPTYPEFSQTYPPSTHRLCRNQPPPSTFASSPSADMTRPILPAIPGASWGGGSHSRAKAPTPKEWEHHRHCITDLYITQDMSLSEVRKYMEEHTTLRASDNMFKRRIKKWGLDKKNKRSEVLEMIRQKRQRSQSGKGSEFWIRGSRVDWDDVERYLRRRPVRPGELGEVGKEGSLSGITVHTPPASPAASLPVPYTSPSSANSSHKKSFKSRRGHRARRIKVRVSAVYGSATRSPTPANSFLTRIVRRKSSERTRCERNFDEPIPVPARLPP